MLLVNGPPYVSSSIVMVDVDTLEKTVNRAVLGNIGPNIACIQHFVPSPSSHSRYTITKDSITWRMKPSHKCLKKRSRNRTFSSHFAMNVFLQLHRWWLQFLHILTWNMLAAGRKHYCETIAMIRRFVRSVPNHTSEATGWTDLGLLVDLYKLTNVINSPKVLNLFNLFHRFYAPSILKDVKLLVKTLQAEARFSNHRIFRLRYWRCRIIPTSICQKFSITTSLYYWSLIRNCQTFFTFILVFHSLKKMAFLSRGTFWINNVTDGLQTNFY